MEWCLIFVTSLLSFPTALAVILEGPKSSVFPEGSNVTLKCLATGGNRIVWEDINDNTVIFIDKTKNTRKLKFDNFVISNDEDNFSLTIVNAQLSDEGFYSCEEGDERRSANVTIEARPNLSILVNNTVILPENPITIIEDEQVFAVCKAVGAKPSVHLKLKFGDNEWIETNYTTKNEGLRFSTETRVVHYVERTDTTLTCQATGQISVPPSTTMISIDVLHKPTCVIELIKNVAECQCVSNPAVSTYNWYINGEPQSTHRSLRIHEFIPANITCIASNEVGISLLASRYVARTDLQSEASPNYVAIIIVAVVVCVIVIGALFIIVYKQSKHPCKCLTDYEKGKSDAEVENNELFVDARDTIAQTAGETIHLKPSSSGEVVDETQGSTSHNTDENTPSNADESKEVFYDAKTTFEEKDEEKSLLASANGKANDDLKLAQLISQIKAAISHDWEIFAIENLELKKELVKEIIRKHPEVSDQLSAALEHWAESCPEATASHLEENILKKSAVFDYYKNRPQPHSREGEISESKTEESESGEQFSQEKLFLELVKEVGKCVGHIGAQRLSGQYREQYVDTFTNSQITALTGESLTELLQKENLLTDDMKSLSRLKNALDDSLLLRASDLVETYITEKEKRETNASSEGTPL